MERDSFFGALRRQWWIVVAAFVVGLAVGAIPTPKSSTDRSSLFEATHTMIISSNDPSGSISSDTMNITELQLLATAGNVPKTVATRLGYANAALLAAQLQVSVDGGSNSITFTTRAPDGQQAEAIVDAFADELSTFITIRQDELREQRLTAASLRLEELQADVRDLSTQLLANPGDRIVQAKLDAATRRYSTVFEEYDTLQGQPRIISLVTLESGEAIPVDAGGFRAPRSRLSRGLLLGVAGAVVGLGVVLLLSLLDPRIRRRAQAEAILGIRSQVTIPSIPWTGERLLAVRRDRHDPVADAYRALRSVVTLANQDRNDPSIGAVTLVVSSGSGDGKTTATANLAAAFVETGARTVAVNTDFRRPQVATMLGAADLDALAPEVPAGTPIVLSGTVPGLRVYDERLSDEVASPSELVRKVRQSVTWLADSYEQVVIDSPPIAHAAEGLEMLRSSDTVVVLVRLGHTRVDDLKRAAETVQALAVTNLLLVTIGGRTRFDEAYYYGSPNSAQAIRSARDAAGELVRRFRFGAGRNPDA